MTQRSERIWKGKASSFFFFFLNGFTISTEVTAALLAGQFCDVILEVLSEKQSSNDSDACDKDEEVKSVLECWL